jgi:hypothetical protein
MRTYVLWALPKDRRLQIGASCSRYAPLPFAAEIITTVDAQDLRLMRRWCERRARSGWTIERLRAACGEPTPF